MSDGNELDEMKKVITMMLQQVSSSVEIMSTNVLSKLDEMSERVDALETTVNQLSSTVPLDSQRSELAALRGDLRSLNVAAASLPLRTHAAIDQLQQRSSADHLQLRPAADASVAASAQWLGKLLSSLQGVHSVLELACCTGLYLVPLKRDFLFAVSGLDVTQQALDVCRAKDKEIPLYCSDMALPFPVKSRYDAVICMNSSLALLPSLDSMVECLKHAAASLRPKGFLVLDLPNHKVEIRESTQNAPPERHGNILVHVSSKREGSKWITERKGVENDQVVFTELSEQLIFPVQEFEERLAEFYTIERRFGSSVGAPFDDDSSKRRVYVCRLHTVK